MQTIKSIFLMYFLFIFTSFANTTLNELEYDRVKIDENKISNHTKLKLLNRVIIFFHKTIPIHLTRQQL
ncbi:hypothetical protein ACFLSH_03980 [Bacteroidota bacterium]